jgi:hypothetical protein
MPEFCQNADIFQAEDRLEPISLMEPMLIGEGSRHRGRLFDGVGPSRSVCRLAAFMNMRLRERISSNISIL